MTLHELVLRDVELVFLPCPHVGQRVLQEYLPGFPGVLARRRAPCPRLRHPRRYLFCDRVRLCIAVVRVHFLGAHI